MKSETDAEVRRNLPPDHVPLFNRVRGQIVESPYMSRTEAFAEYIEEHPGELAASCQALADFKLKSVLRPMLDFYETPAWAVRAILPHLPAVHEGTQILDPGCGTGAILRELVKAWPHAEIVGLEKEEGRYKECEVQALPVVQGDFLICDDKFDMIISNPPYVCALEFVQHAISRAPVVCMLLRLPWLASQRRAAWHKENPAALYVLPRRPSFTNDGKTDATDYAWFLWGHAQPGTWTILDVEKRGTAEVPF